MVSAGSALAVDHVSKMQFAISNQQSVEFSRLV
jgi:hypothetical protein